jgi:hypothetical protein
MLVANTHYQVNSSAVALGLTASDSVFAEFLRLNRCATSTLLWTEICASRADFGNLGLRAQPALCQVCNLAHWFVFTS